MDTPILPQAPTVPAQQQQALPFRAPPQQRPSAPSPAAPTAPASVRATPGQKTERDSTLPSVGVVKKPEPTVTQPAAPPSGTAPTRTVVSPRGSYLVGRQVGGGHFGSVFECLGPFDQRYALKVLNPMRGSPDQIRREWEDEVRRLMQLRHPNVVYIHDAFVWQGSFCMALEWCDHTLKDMLQQALGEELVIELSRQLLAGVQYLHDSDIVHDDLHPGNVLIQQMGRPVVKISDFGISSELRGAPKVRPSIVHHAIMAPELIAAGYSSKQSDLYQLGLIMYWMVTGTPPIQMNVPYDQLVSQITQGIARQRAEALGTGLGNVIAKLLRRRDTYRYTSAREVWEDLSQLPAWRERRMFPLR